MIGIEEVRSAIVMARTEARDGKTTAGVAAAGDAPGTGDAGADRQGDRRAGRSGAARDCAPGGRWRRIVRAGRAAGGFPERDGSGGAGPTVPSARPGGPEP